MIFIDSDAYLALNLREDSNKEKAIRIARTLFASNEPTATSWDVIDEVSTKLSYHFDHGIAREFTKKIVASGTLIHFVSEIIVGDIVTLFLKQTSKNVSMTDCANMVIARSLGITTFFSFDRHYVKNGFQLLG